MNALNRSAITVTFKKPFIEWNNNLSPDLPMYEDMIGESTTYLVNDDFDDAGEIIKKHYKEIFENELLSMWTDEDAWPQKRTLKLFHEWFNVEVADMVFDICTKKLKSIDFD